MSKRYDVAILGSSFSGSILAAILASQGMSVLMLDRGQHPRFAIGESSTPTADFLLEAIAKRWNLTTLLPLARWGTWQASYPQLTAGKKRGFSYFAHHSGQPFSDNAQNENSLLVAASVNDALSDTHWLRADVDHFLFQHAQSKGVEAFERCEKIELKQDPTWNIRWQLPIGNTHTTCDASANWLIDATGAGGVLAKTVGLQAHDHQLLTQTGALFSHFQDVASWDELQQQAGNDSTLQPFNSDDAAQHHLMENGWMWVLRFNNRCTSVGVVKPTSYWDQSNINNQDLLPTWQHELSKYPSVQQMLAPAEMKRPLQFQRKLSRIWSSASGDGWAMLPTTAGFIDPLHSSGIAHALSGVYRLASLLLNAEYDPTAWMQYGLDVLDEVHWIDQLVDACYTALPNFDCFCMAANFYFLSAIDAERDFASSLSRQSSNISHGDLPSFLSSQKTPLRQAVATSIRELKVLAQASNSESIAADDRARWIENTRIRIAAWNWAGLGDREAHNRYARSAAEK